MSLFSMLGHLAHRLEVFGFLKGIQIYLQIKFNKTRRIALKGIAHPFGLRPGTKDAAIFYQIFLNREYDISLDFEPRLIIDAGANIGLSAIYFANKYPEAKIISIEPELSNFEMLKKNTRAYPNVISLHKALSGLAGETLSVRDRGFGSSGFMTEAGGDATGEGFQNKVQTTSVEELMNEYGFEHPDIVKIDIKGYEKELFESDVTAWLPKTRCLLIELHDRMKPGCSKSFFKAVSTYDFTFSMLGENLVFVNDDRHVF